MLKQYDSHFACVQEHIILITIQESKLGCSRISTSFSISTSLRGHDYIGYDSQIS